MSSKKNIKFSVIRVCKICGKSGDGKLFAKGGHGNCNKCNKSEWDKNNPDKVRAQRLWGNAYKRAKSLNWP